MRYTFPYDGTEEEQERIEQEQKPFGRYLIGVQNLSDGNYLEFSDEPLESPESPMSEIQRLKKELEETRETVHDLVETVTDIILGGE